MYKIDIMSGSAAISRAKARRGMVQNEISMSNEAAKHFGKEGNKEVSPEQLIIQHDYKLFVFEQKIRELYENMNNVKDPNSLQSINESMLSEALQSLDNRIENIEKSPVSSISEERISTIEQDQKELKGLLLKIQNMTMETSIKLMKLQDSIKYNKVEIDPDEQLDISFSEINIEENKENKKKKK